MGTEHSIDYTGQPANRRGEPNLASQGAGVDCDKPFTEVERTLTASNNNRITEHN